MDYLLSMMGTRPRDSADAVCSTLQAHGASHPEVSEYLQLMAKQYEIITDLTEENKKLKQDLDEVKQQLKDLKKDKEAKGPPPACLIQNTCRLYNSYVKEFAVQVHCSTSAFEADTAFFNKVCQDLKGHGLHLRKEDYTAESDKLLLLFCPSFSRTGTDIDSALSSIKSERSIILVVMHHTPVESKKLYVNSKSLVSHRSILCVVDCQFFEMRGLFDCSLNTEAINKVSSVIWQLYSSKSL
ncbi:uncharacterized protein LOC122794358 [Protopterus annectens]|uniref:uncharacterized protein LOC122794358 n=1 Tax=Protopterus annectens TaxID=7888 RepID=UPI001CFA6BD6|nr:uncharacterized protein LOC122794358 [Protopterus annectens]